MKGVEHVGRVLSGVPLDVATDPATLCQGQSGNGEHEDQLDDHCRPFWFNVRNCSGDENAIKHLTGGCFTSLKQPKITHALILEITNFDKSNFAVTGIAQSDIFSEECNNIAQDFLHFMGQ